MAPDYSVNTKGLAIEETREFIITYILTFMFIILFGVPFKTYFIYILRNLCQLYVLVGIFLQPLCIGHKIIGLYQAAHEAGKFQAPAPKTQEKKLKKASNTIIVGTTTTRCVLQREPSMTYGNHPQ